MGVRDLSPPVWVAPSSARVSISALITALGPSTLPLDEWISNYSPGQSQVVNLSNGFNALTVPDTTNVRFLILTPPRGNIVAWTVKGLTGDQGLEQHPNGVFMTSFDGTAFATVGITTGGAIAGFQVTWL